MSNHFIAMNRNKGVVLHFIQYLKHFVAAWHAQGNMLVRTSVIFVLTSALLCGTYNANAQNSRYAKLDSIMVDLSDSVGSSALLLVNDRQILYNFLSTDKGGFRIQKEMPIGAASQWLVAATLLALEDEGALSLDKSIGTYLTNVPSAFEAITIHQLLAHTSGLPAQSKYVNNNDLSLKESVAKLLSDISLEREPGLAFNYGAVSYQLAGRVAEEVTGENWQDIFYEQIARPCNMTRTYFDEDRAPYIAEGVVSTPSDFVNFLMMLLNEGQFKGRRILQKGSIYQMTQDRTGNLPIVANAEQRKTAKYGNHFGLGVWIDKVDAKSGVTIEVSNPGTRSFLPWLNDCEEVAGIFATRGEFKDMHRAAGPLKQEVDKIFTDSCKVAITRRDDPSTIKPDADVSNPLEEKGSPSQKMIRFELDEAATVNLKLFDSLGNEVAELVDKRLEAGEYAIPVDKSKYNAGVYLYRLIIDERSETKKLTLKK